MRILCGMIIVTLGFGVASASRAAQTSTQPRLTTDDYRRFMKTVGTAYPAMRMHLMDGMTAEAAKEAQVLAETFGSVERFWTQSIKADAMKLAQQARMYATETAGAATGGDAAKATTTATNMQACASSATACTARWIRPTPPASASSRG